jgi:hypothetical protein
VPPVAGARHVHRAGVDAGDRGGTRHPQAAVKQHLANLFDKFGVAPTDDHRRSRLANEALRRGAVSLTQLR